MFENNLLGSFRNDKSLRNILLEVNYTRSIKFLVVLLVIEVGVALVNIFLV